MSSSPSPTSSSAWSRLQTLVGHIEGPASNATLSSPSSLSFSPSSSSEQKLSHTALSSNDTANSVFFGPSKKTVGALTQLGKFTKKAVELPFGTVRNFTLEFEPDRMTALLWDGFDNERKKMLALLADHPIFKNKHMVGLSMDQQRELVLEQVKVVANSDIYRFRDVLDNKLRWVTLMETLYYHGINLGTKAGVHFGLFGGTLCSLGTQPHIDQFADKIANLDVRGAFCLTELGHGSNARGIETTATYDSKTDEFVLHTPTETAQKIWIGNLALHANWGVVFAQLSVSGVERGVHAFLVPIRDEKGQLCPGVRVKDCGAKSGLNGVDNGRLWLDHKRVPKSALLNKFGDVVKGVYQSPIAKESARFTAMISALVGGRIVVAQGAANITKVGLTVAIKYALSRKQFGPADKAEIPLMDYLSHQRRLFPLLAKTFALQFGLNHVKRLYGQQESNSSDAHELHILAAGLKPFCTWHRSMSLQIARECCGGMGFHAANRIGPLKADSDIDVTWEGDNTVLLQQVSASLLKEFRRQVGKGSYVGMLSYLGRQMSLEIRDKNPLKKGLTSEQHLLDLEFYEDALEYREARLLRSLINKLRRHSSEDPFYAWNDSLDIALELGKAHVDRILMHQFAKAIEHAERSLQPMLHVLCSLYALSCIQENMGWYLTFRYFSPAKSKAIWEEVNTLCNLLRPFAGRLVDSFGIPAALLDAPIAGDWEAAFSYPNVPY